MKWLEDKQLLITCAKDKTVKIWQLPVIWMNEGEQQTKQKETQQVEQVETAPHKVDSEEEDDLTGWNK